MKILNIEGRYFVEAFRSLGHEVLTLGQGPGFDVPLDEMLSTRALWDLLASKNFRPDLALWCDHCTPPVVLGLETLPCLTVGFSIDQYCNPWHVPLSAGFDILLAAQKDYAPLFQDARLPRRAEWFPLFCDADRDRDPGLERDIPVCFVGTQDPPLNPMRKPFLDAFRRGAPLLARTGDFRPLFGRSRLVLNQCAVGELNFRIFEAMACGAALLTEDCENGLRDLFTPGEELLIYRRGDAAHAAATARTALERPDLAQLARRGRDAVHARHSSLVRAKRILSLSEAALRRGQPRWRRENASLVREETARAYAMLATDATLRLPDSLRTHFAGLALRMEATAHAASDEPCPTGALGA
ncbi:Glycosyl transferases group 1 [Humidesulfovibrio mexicanus]|uniref:Glycosyl transferases group 1 n=1 Tax=Humidesulfovibrio mexicanus TaxID=147047 RepID=A0A239B3K0_9BACT|nr:glycosyltransferase [Humidesulfovibrio mexicanus]SNS02400.1 Glycosyl transferases group 1 [Humidesulfovibrio mexicanus]